GGLGTVVVDAHAAANVEHREARAHLVELGVDVGELVDGVLEDADVVELAADVAVEEFEAVEHVVLFEVLDCLEDFGDKEAELAADAGGAFPAAGAAAAELDAQA